MFQAERRPGGDPLGAFFFISFIYRVPGSGLCTTDGRAVNPKTIISKRKHA